MTRHYYTIIDCDPGIDDAMAIMNAVSSDHVCIKLISTVSGNLSIDNTLKNTLKICELLGVDIPVSRGASSPLKRQAVYATMAQGTAGFGGYQYDKVAGREISLQGEDAIHYYLHDTLSKNTTIVCLGPMTNIAKLLKKYPEDKDRIARIVFMGGSKDEEGDVAPYREFNIAYDPEATRQVIASGVPLVMIPMELGHIAYFDKAEQKLIRRMNALGKTFYKMFQNYNDYHVGRLGAAVHDSCAVLYLSFPEIFKTAPARLELKYYKAGDTEYGYVDCSLTKENKNALVCVDMDIDKFKTIVYGNLAKFC